MNARACVSQRYRRKERECQSGDYPIPFAENGSYPVRAGNRVRPLIDGEPAYSRICEAVEAAQHSVWLTVAWIWETFPPARRPRLAVRSARCGNRARPRRARDLLSPHGRRAVSAPHHLRRHAGAAAVAGKPRLAFLRALGFDAGLVVPSSEELDRRRRATTSEIAFVGGMNMKPSTLGVARPRQRRRHLAGPRRLSGDRRPLRHRRAP